MKFKPKIFVVPKENCSENECEDACAFDGVYELRFAIADSSSNGSYSNIWANIIVNEYVSRFGNNLVENIRQLEYRWHSLIKWQELPWYKLKKARRGDRSTFLGISFSPPCNNMGIWKAVAVGDSCLFQIREDKLFRAFPMQRTTDFPYRPDLLSSIPGSDKTLPQCFKVQTGEYSVQDMIIMCTDALAIWFLNSYENGAKPWSSLRQLEEKADFIGFVNNLRKSNNIENDDTTLLLIEFKNTELMRVNYALAIKS